MCFILILVFRGMNSNNLLRFNVGELHEIEINVYSEQIAREGLNDEPGEIVSRSHFY